MQRGGEEEQPPLLPPPPPPPPSELRALPPGTSVRDALILYLGALEGRGMPELRESAVHLLLHALGLDWDDGHCRLREAMASPPPPPTRAGRTRQLSVWRDGPCRQGSACSTYPSSRGAHDSSRCSTSWAGGISTTCRG